jgi:hypothetical protein
MHRAGRAHQLDYRGYILLSPERVAICRSDVHGERRSGLTPSMRKGTRQAQAQSGDNKECYTDVMANDLIEDALRVLRDLPEDVQVAIARGIIAYVDGDDDVLFAR